MGIRTLKKIHVSGVCVDDELVEHLCQHLCHQLTVLDMPFCERVTDKTSDSIAMCEKLTCLNLSYSKITDITIQRVSSKCKLLKQVDVTQTKTQPDLSVTNILQLLKSCMRLNLLKVNGRLI